MPDPKPNRMQLWAMAHPLRYRILELLAEGPSTASELASRMNESRGSTSYHLRMLARAEAVVEDLDRGTKRERWWRRPREPAPAADGRRRRGTRDQLADAAHDPRARRRGAATLHHAGGRRPVARERLHRQLVRRAVVELSHAEADELGQHLASIVMALRGRRDAFADGAHVRLGQRAAVA
jgi:DNA-binding transcriptional ArsR family regulator